jgi:hypothetical protein
MTTDQPLVIPMSVVLHACDEPLQQAAAHQHNSTTTVPSQPKASWQGPTEAASCKAVAPATNFLDVCHSLRLLMLSYTQFGEHLRCLNCAFCRLSSTFQSCECLGGEMGQMFMSDLPFCRGPSQVLHRGEFELCACRRASIRGSLGQHSRSTGLHASVCAHVH